MYLSSTPGAALPSYSQATTTKSQRAGFRHPAATGQLQIFSRSEFSRDSRHSQSAREPVTTEAAALYTNGVKLFRH
jgi:hypothetical protein